jgi:type II secretory pathway predicted ATPase ExeA
MQFSESEIQPLGDEVARIIGEGVIELRHRGEPLTADSLIDYLEHKLSTAGVQQRILIGAAVNLLKADRRS